MTEVALPLLQGLQERGDEAEVEGDTQEEEDKLVGGLHSLLLGQFHQPHRL